MNGEMMTLTFFEFFSLYKKISTILFPYLLVYLFKQRYISFVKSCKYLNKLISIKSIVLAFHERIEKYHALAHCICIYIAIVWLAIEIK